MNLTELVAVSSSDSPTFTSACDVLPMRQAGPKLFANCDDEQVARPIGQSLYQPAVILTYEDWQSRLLARRSGSGDVVHRCDALTQSSGRDCQPAGRLLVALGHRRALVTMNHIVTSDAPCREPPEAVLIGQDYRRLVLALFGPLDDVPSRRGTLGRSRTAMTYRANAQAAAQCDPEILAVQGGDKTSHWNGGVVLSVAA